MEPNTPATQAFSQGGPIQDNPDQDGPGAPTGDGISTPTRPKGLNASAIVLGVMAVALAGLLIAIETMNVSVDWSRVGPGAIVGVGLLLVVLGVIGLVRRREDS